MFNYRTSLWTHVALQQKMRLDVGGMAELER
jgi:hypothetical protein